MSYSYKVAVTRKNQIKYIEAHEFATYKQLGWLECTGIPGSLDTICDVCREVVCECDSEYNQIPHEQTQDSTEINDTNDEAADTISATLKPVKRRK